MLALGDGVLAAAESFFRKYRDATNFKEPDFTDATVLLMRTRLRRDDIDGAREALAYHAGHSPGVDEPEYAEMLGYWRTALLFAEGRIEDGLRAAEQFLETAEAPDLKANALFLKATALAREKEWNEAIAVYRQILDEYPQSENASDARFRLANAFLVTGELDKTEAMLSEIDARIAETGGAGGTQLGIYQALLNLARGQLDEALGIYRQIEKARPANPDHEWWLLLSQLVSESLKRERFELAAELATAATAMADSQADRLEMRLQLAEALIKVEKTEQAVAAVEKLRTDFPEAREISLMEFKLAELLRRKERFAEAATYLERLAADEQTPQGLKYQAQLSRGWSLVRAEQFEKAIGAFTAAERLGQTPEQKAEALLLAGDAAARNNDHSSAALYYQNVADNYKQTEFAEPARFRQAQSRAAAGLHSDAALVYRQYLAEYPEGDQRRTSALERGIALKAAGNYSEAIIALKAFAAMFPDDPSVPRALMEGYAAAKAEANVDTALEFLDLIVANHEKSDLFVHALYNRIHYLFLQGRDEEALADVELFLERYSRLPLGADVALWTGDYYANQGEYVKAEEYYLQAVTDSPEAAVTQAQIGLFEAARCAYRRGDIGRAVAFLDQLTADYKPDKLPDLHARARMLLGDIQAERGEFQRALDQFRTAAETAQKTRLRLNAVGRAGDMFFSLAGENDEDAEQRHGLFQKAVELYLRIIADENVTPPLHEKARYRLAKCYEKMGEADKAVETFLDIFYGYELELKNNDVMDWYYFARSGYDAARLLVLQETPRGNDNLKSAARIYERLAAAGIPTAADARQRAIEIRAKLEQE